MSLHTHTQHLTVLALTMKQIRSVHHYKCKLSGRQADLVFVFFFLLVLIQEYEPAAKASVVGCVFRKWSWREGLSKDIIYTCCEEFKKNMDFGGCCDTHFLFLQNPFLAFDGHSD